jgi:hypothetical protein
MLTPRSSLAGLAVFSLVVLGACGSDSKASGTVAPAGTAAPAGSAAPGATVTGSIDAADQTSDGKTITVSSVNVTGSSGFIAVHVDTAGAPGPVVGHATIPEGDSKDVVITLDTPVATGVSLWPMLHTDAGTIGTYEFPGPDGPVKSADGVVMKKITVTVG